MNEIIRVCEMPATVAIAYLNTAFDADRVDWPSQEPVYVTASISPTFSFFEKSLSNIPATASHNFAQEIASIFASLSEDQEPLGAEFEAVWDANVETLYQS